MQEKGGLVQGPAGRAGPAWHEMTEPLDSHLTVNLDRPQAMAVIVCDPPLRVVGNACDHVDLMTTCLEMVYELSGVRSDTRLVGWEEQTHKQNRAGPACGGGEAGGRSCSRVTPARAKCARLCPHIAPHYALLRAGSSVNPASAQITVVPPKSSRG